MQIPILSGIYADGTPELRTSYPVNYVPVPKNSGINTGYLRPADGIVANGAGLGIDRGGINWKGVCYRVMGQALTKVLENGTTIDLGYVGGSGLVSFDYSFDRLAIASGGALYYYNGTALSKVTDTDLGNVVDFVWVDGYFMTTDGTSLVVTELSDPMQVNPLKYGSSEVDPDPVVALVKLRNEVYALNRHTIEVFDNVGGDLFPFARIDGAQVQKGAIGTHACCVFMDRVAFLGGGRNEPPSIHIAAAGQTQKISTQEIDELLTGYTEAQLSAVKLETRTDKSHQQLYIHLPDRTIVYDGAASEQLGEQVWFTLTSALRGFAQYRARNFVYAYDKWLVGDPQSPAIGYFSASTGHHWGQQVRWEFGTMIVFNEGRGAIFHNLELVALTGSIEPGKTPMISASYTLDGRSWSQNKAISAASIGTNGANKRLVWFMQGHMRQWRIQRFTGDTDAHVSFVRLDAQIEALA